MMSNFDLLNTRQQMLLKVASVLGKVISVEVLDAIFPAEAKRNCDIPTEIARSLEDGIVRPPPPRSPPRPDLFVQLVRNNQGKHKNNYLFSSNLFQEVAYGMMLEDHRKALHHAAGAYYENEFLRTDELSPVYSLLIYHFEKAGAMDKVEYYRERMEARKRWQYAYRLVSAVEFWGRKRSTSVSGEPVDIPPRPSILSGPRLSMDHVSELAAFTPKPSKFPLDRSSTPKLPAHEAPEGPSPNPKD